MITVEVEDDAWRTALPGAEAVVERAAEAALAPFPLEGGRVGDRGVSPTLREEGREAQPSSRPSDSSCEPSPQIPQLQSAHPHPRPLPPQGGGENIVILLTSDDTVRDLNARFRAKPTATNVLSFPAPESARPHLGDIALAYGVCAAEAAAQGKSLDRHLSHLVIHGVLHLMGHDHEREDEAEAMEARERALMADLGYPDPYAETEPADHARR